MQMKSLYTRLIVMAISALQMAMHGQLLAQETLTAVTTPTFAYLDGSKAVYQDYPASKAAIVEIDVNTKVKRPLLPDAGGTAPFYYDYGCTGIDMAYVTFSNKPVYPLEYMNTQTKEKKSLSADQGWKESVWVGKGMAVWVDYRHKTASDKNGEIYMCTLPSGTEKRVTTSVSYQAKPVTDGKHIAWLDYADGKIANVILYDISSGGLVTPAASPSHQDNPRIDGDYLVWEDYRNAKSDTTNVDIFSYNIKSKVVTPLCTQPRFQGRLFLQGLGVVWEDYRNTGSNKDNVDIYGYDLAENKEVAVSTRSGYDASPVIYLDKALWCATTGSTMNLVASTLTFNKGILAVGPRTRPRIQPLSDELFRPDGRKVAGTQASFPYGYIRRP